MNCGFCAKPADELVLVETCWMHKDCAIEVVWEMMMGEEVDLVDNMEEYERTHRQPPGPHEGPAGSPGVRAGDL